MTVFILVLFLSRGGLDTDQRIVAQFDTWKACESEGGRRVSGPLKAMSTSNFASFNEPEPINYRCDPVQIVRK